MIIKLALSGKSRTGKSEAEKYLVDKFNCSPYDFSDQLKDDFHLEYPHIPRIPKPRKGYILYGELKRYVNGECYWVDKCFVRVNEDCYKARWAEIVERRSNMFKPLITGVRQPHEFRRLREEGFFIIRLSAPESVQIERCEKEGDNFSLEDLRHETETHLMTEKVDYDIVNDGTIEELHKKLDAVMLDIYAKLQGVK